MTKKKSRRKWVIIGLLILIGIIAAAAIVQSRKGDDGLEVETEVAEMKSIKETVSASGRIYPEVEVIISSDVSGEIVDLYVEEGDSVIEGQLLLKIDPEVYVSAVERGEANLNNAKAQLAMSRAQIETNKAQKVESTTDLKQAERDHNRNIKLFEDGVISQAEFDETLSRVESAQARIESAQANINAAIESARGSEFSVKSSEATLKEMRTNLNRTVIKAPNSGIISSLSVEQGERVVGTAQMAGTEIMRISNLNSMEVQVEVSENDILKVALGDEVEIEVDAYLERKFAGRVTEIASSAANIAGSTGTATLNTDQVTNFIVKVRISPESYADVTTNYGSYAFRPGMSASVNIVTDVKANVLTVPIQSVAVRILDEDDKDADYEEVVFLYEADTARLVPVTSGIQDDESIHITSGIEAGTEIISGPYSALSKDLENGSILKLKEKGKGDKKKRGE